MSDDNTVLSLRYIGKQPKKRDNVAGSSFKWNRRGEVVDVPKTIALKLLQHPDVWVVADSNSDPMKGEPHAGLSDEKIAQGLLPPGAQYVMTRSEKIKAAIDLIESLNGWDEVVAYRQLGEVVKPTHHYLNDEYKMEVTLAASFSNEREEAIAEAIALLDTDNTDHFTDQGVPRVNAINELLSGMEPATAVERNEVWLKIQEASQGRDAA